MAEGGLLRELGIAGLEAGAGWGEWVHTSGEPLASVDPTTEATIATVASARRPECQLVLAKAAERFASWRLLPAPRRGAVVRRLADELRAHKHALAALITLEVGKVQSEALGEIESMIAVCDLAVGLSRQLHGLTIASERPGHRLFEQWHPLGPIGIVSAFNFPMAVWAWNAAIGAVCGDVCIWKPSPHAPLCALAVQQICHRVMQQEDCAGVFNLVVGGADVGEWLAQHKQVPLVSFTGSISAGREVATRVAARLGRSILELGGNNGIIVLDDADLEVAVPALSFAGLATAGQRCSSARRIFAQSGIAPALAAALRDRYSAARLGDPADPLTGVGPLISQRAVDAFEAAVAMAVQLGGEVVCGGRVPRRGGYFVEPTLVRAPGQGSFPIAWEETFAPILYLFEVTDLDHAIAEHNAVTQGLCGALFTGSLAATEKFLSVAGCDCGMANVNLGTAGVEVGGAFGGEKDSGSGREMGADAWKAYMRRQTCTVRGGAV